ISFVVVAAIVSGLIDQLARRQIGEARAKAEAEALARLAGRPGPPDGHALRNLIDQLRATFNLDAVAVLEPGETRHQPWRVQVASGSPVPACPEEAAVDLPLDAGLKV